jgi:hypothetical protein
VLGDLQSQLTSEMSSLRWDYDGFYLEYRSIYAPWTLGTVYGYGRADGYRFTDGWFRGDAALGEWRNNQLGGRYDHNLYEKMDFSQRSQFEREFVNVYNQVIDQKFFAIAHTVNFAAQSRGQWYGAQAADKMAYQSGYRDGYVRSYREASIEGYRQTFSGAFRAAFDNTVGYYQNNPVLRMGQVRLIDGNGNGIFEAGESVKLEIGSVVNYGRRDATVPVRISGEMIELLPQRADLTVERSSSTRGQKKVIEVGKISTAMQIDTRYTVRVAVGDAESSVSFSESWRDILTLFVQTRRGDQRNQVFADFIVNKLKAEWLQALKAGTGIFGKGYDQSLLDRLVTFHERSSQDGKMHFRDIAGRIYKIQESGGGIHPFLRRAYRSLASYIK